MRLNCIHDPTFRHPSVVSSPVSCDLKSQRGHGIVSGNDSRVFPRNHVFLVSHEARDCEEYFTE
jgi:hypothetical protein